VALLAPLGLLPLWGGRDIVGALPALAENLLSSDPVLYNYRAQYQAFLLPFLFLAAIAGYARLTARRTSRWPISPLAVAFVSSLVLASPLANDLAVARWWPAQEQRAAYRVLAQVPPAASLSVQDRYVPHLSLRRVVTVFPTGLDRAEYVLVNEEAYPWHGLADVKLERDADAVTIAMAGRRFRYRVVTQAGPHLLLHRS
jgi:uncharacterized membrane protein